LERMKLITSRAAPTWIIAVRRKAALNPLDAMALPTRMINNDPPKPVPAEMAPKMKPWLSLNQL